jgi:hypothetical protein
MGGEGDFVGGQFDVNAFPGAMPGGGPPGGLPDFLKPENQEAFARMQEAQKKNRDEASAKIGELLTAEQKTAFEKLTGKPFDFSKLQTASAEPKAAEGADAKEDGAMKKDAPAKADSKTKSKKSNRE